MDRTPTTTITHHCSECGREVEDYCHEHPASDIDSVLRRVVEHEIGSASFDADTSGPFEPGDWLVDRRVAGAHDWGQVVGVDADDEVTVSWHGSLTTTTQPASALEGVEVYSDHEAAQFEYERA